MPPVPRPECELDTRGEGIDDAVDNVRVFSGLADHLVISPFIRSLIIESFDFKDGRELVIIKIVHFRASMDKRLPPEFSTIKDVCAMIA